MTNPSTASSASTGLYYDFSFPLQLVQFLVGLIQGLFWSPNTPQIDQGSANRVWFSQPRGRDDQTVEVLTIRYKIPLSMSELGFTALRVPCHIEAWYQDRSNNWRPILDTNRIPVALDLSGSDVVSWYAYHADLYEIVAKAFQLRMTRKNDPQMGNQQFVIGIHDILARRNVYARAQGTSAFADTQDIVGNVISSYIKDWDASKAIDDNYTTFWKCSPQPDPAAVVNLFLNVRDPATGDPEPMERIFIDPVYMGQNLNLYYSNDDTVGTRTLSPITQVPDNDVDTQWTQGIGRADISTSPYTTEAIYTFPVSFGAFLDEDMWVGIEWTPDFPAGTPPANNPVLFKVTPTAPVVGVFTPTIYYDGGAGEVVLLLTDGTTNHVFTAGLVQVWDPAVPLRIVVGWRYEENQVYINVKDGTGQTLATSLTNFDLTNLTKTISLDGDVGIQWFRGLYTALIVKAESYLGQVDAFAVNPGVYVNPDPVIPDVNGVIPSTTLDNALYAVDWTLQEHGTGGPDDSHFDSKEWTPIWKNYVTEKGFLYLPQTITAKYLKFEVSNLAPEPYPIYDSGIQTSYKVFPVAVSQQSSIGPQIYSTPGGFLGLGNIVSVNGVTGVNWLNPASLANAFLQVFGNTTTPISIQTSPGYVTDLPPNTGITDVNQTYGIELGNQYIYRRTALDPYILAQDTYATTIKAEGLQAIQPYTTIPWQDIAATNPGVFQTSPSPGALPVRGTDYWVVPGATLKIPASTMTQLTSGDTVTDFHADLTHRTRFQTTSVHRYDIRTVTRDKAIGYFTGFREIQPYSESFIAGQDPDTFTFSDYHSPDWHMTNTVKIDSGPVSSAGSPYVVPNGEFAIDLSHFDQVGVWDFDATTGHTQNCAHITPTGSVVSLTTQDVIPVAGGALVTLSAWVRYENAVSAAGGYIELLAIPYHNGVAQPVVHLTGGYSIINTPTGPSTSHQFVQLIGTYSVPASGVESLKMRVLANGVTADDLWYDSFAMDPPTGAADGVLTAQFTTTSSFDMVQCSFSDSGLLRSDPMWADIDPLDDTNIPNDLLSYHVSPIPGDIPRGFWDDAFATWDDPTTNWGEPHSVVAINIDADRVYDGKRVLHFTRDAGGGEAGVNISQVTHMVPEALARLNAVFYKTNANANLVTVRLIKHDAPEFPVYEQNVVAPAGYWFTYQSPFFEIPDGLDQVYDIQLVLNGDAADDFYLSDLYTEVANIRYHVNLDGFYHDVTDLVYSGTETYVSTTVPVNQFTATVTIKSPEAWCNGCSFLPNYLVT